MKVKLYTLGCKVNQYETQEITENLIKNGFEITLDDSAADVFIVNSCTVTKESDRKTRQLVRRLKRENENSAVLLTGCYPQAFPDEAKLLTQADIVIGNKNNAEIIKLIKKFFNDKNRLVDISEHLSGEKYYGSGINSFNERTRAIVKIEDGCDRFCSYCIIPTARGRVRSKPLADIKTEVEALAQNGYIEVVLVGINLSAYGKDTGEKFTDAVKTASSVEGIKRVRLGSLEPDHITDEVISELSKLQKLCPQFHISLQSGCDRTLKRMNRHYTAAEYEELCTKLRNSFKDCTLTTDIMVGFAGETDEDFEETVKFAERIGFEKIHIFPYSVREGTRAAQFPEQIEKSLKEERAARLNETAQKLREEFFRSQIGKEVEIIPESKHRSGRVFGYTPNYTPVLLTMEDSEAGKPVKVLISDSDDQYCYAVEIKGDKK